jgi:hypothetical protein
MDPISLVHLCKLLLPNPHSHWSATGPRSKTQPTATLNTQQQPTRLSCWQSKTDSHVVPTRPWFWGSTKKLSMTSSFYSCHHAACTWLRWPPGPLSQADSSSPHLEVSPATTFHACSSLAPTPVKPQHAPAILSQESVHSTLSVTHHTRKRPSSGPRTTNGPQSPPWWVHWQHTHIVIWEKIKGKEMNKRNSNKWLKA